MTILTGDATYSWIITIIAGISKALQNMFFDNYRNLYLEHVYGKASGLDEEIKEYSEEKERLKSVSGHHIEKMLISLYLAYSKLQKNSTKHTELNVTPEEYKSQNKFLLRLWSWLGSTTHMVGLIFFSIINRIDLYLIFVVTWGNLMFVILWLWQKRVTNSVMLETSS